MKKFAIPLLSVIFATLIAGSIQSISADHLEKGEEVFSDEGVKLVTTEGSKYQLYLQVILRNGDGQLINVTESTANGGYLPQKVSDHVFDTLMGKKEIITTDNKKYEKTQYIFSPTLEQRFIKLYPIFSEAIMEIEVDKDTLAKMDDQSVWKIHYCANLEVRGYSCIPIFQINVPNMTLESHDVVTLQWTILREMN